MPIRSFEKSSLPANVLYNQLFLYHSKWRIRIMNPKAGNRHDIWGLADVSQSNPGPRR